MQHSQIEQAVEQDRPETKRDRVRRLLINPMRADGMRFKAGTPDDIQRNRLDRMADDLAYMGDANLNNLLTCLRTKGDGAKGTFWPARVTVLKFANMAQPRPIEDIPGLRSWFTSAAGTAAAAVPGRLVAEYAFWCKHFHPPVEDVHKRALVVRAKELADREAYLASREFDGAQLSDADSGWLSRYREREAMLRGWISGNGGQA